MGCGGAYVRGRSRGVVVYTGLGVPAVARWHAFRIFFLDGFVGTGPSCFFFSVLRWALWLVSQVGVIVGGCVRTPVGVRL